MSAVPSVALTLETSLTPFKNGAIAKVGTHMTNRPLGNRVTRFLRVLFGQLACCHCGQWSRPRAQRAQGGDRRIWYCSSCGGLIAPDSVPFWADLVVYFLLCAVSTPVIIMLSTHVLDDMSGTFWVVFCLAYAVICGFATTYLSVAIWNGKYTRLVEKHGYCLQCGYNLNYSVSDRYSECGAPAVDVREAIVKWKGRGARAVAE